MVGGMELDDVAVVASQCRERSTGGIFFVVEAIDTYLAGSIQATIHFSNP